MGEVPLYTCCEAVYGLGFAGQDPRFRVHGSRFGVEGSSFRVHRGVKGVGWPESAPVGGTRNAKRRENATVPIKWCEHALVQPKKL